MKKKILFIIPGLDHGGTNKSLQNMLSLLDNSKYDFYILPINQEGPYKNIFSCYNIIALTGIYYTYFSSCRFFMRILRGIDRRCGYVFTYFLYNRLAGIISRQYSFDIVVDFEESQVKYLATSFKAYKIAWVHCDYKYYNEINSPNLRKEESLYAKYDKIVCVSDYTTKSFIDFFPTLTDKTISIHNTLNIDEIKSLSEQKGQDIFGDQTFNIISIGRFAPVKRFDIIPQIVNTILLKDDSIKLKWYIIGDGYSKYRNLLKANIKKYNVEDYVILLGLQDNPYPFIKQSDLLVSTSYSEACPYVVNEAKILHIPVVVTDFESAYEMVKDDNGIIVDVENISDTIFKLAKDCNRCYTSLYERVISTSYTNDAIVGKLNKLFGGITK